MQLVTMEIMHVAQGAGCTWLAGEAACSPGVLQLCAAHKLGMWSAVDVLTADVRPPPT